MSDGAAMTTGSSGRTDSLDSLRGLAIAGVLGSHLMGAAGLDALHSPLVFGLGRGGVTLFFLLSGYLIFRNVRTQPTGVFLCRRFFKVMPSYWLNILVILAADLSLDGFAHFPLKSYIASAAASSDLLGIEAVSGVFWTLLIEIKFYLFIALQYRLLGQRHLHKVLLGLLALEGLAWALRGHGSLTLSYFPVFYLGIEIALAEDAGWTGRAMARLGVVTALLSASLLAFLDQSGLLAALTLMLGTGGFVLLFRLDLSHRLAGFLGATSYSNYLYHSIVAGSVLAMFDVSRHPGSLPLALAVAFAAALLAAALLYGLVEVPMVRCGRYLSRLL